MARKGKNGNGGEKQPFDPLKIEAEFGKGRVSKKRENTRRAKTAREVAGDLGDKKWNQHADRSKQRFFQETGLEPPVEIITQPTGTKSEETVGGVDLDDLLDRVAAKSQEVSESPAVKPAKPSSEILDSDEKEAFNEIFTKNALEEDGEDEESGEEIKEEEKEKIEPETTDADGDFDLDTLSAMVFGKNKQNQRADQAPETPKPSAADTQEQRVSESAEASLADFLDSYMNSGQKQEAPVSPKAEINRVDKENNPQADEYLEAMEERAQQDRQQFLEQQQSTAEPEPVVEVAQPTAPTRPYVAWDRGGRQFGEHFQKTIDRQDITADSLLNNGEFIKWLAQYYEDEEVSEENVDRLKEIFAEFDFEKMAQQQSRQVLREFKITYSGEIRQALGVELTNRDFADVETWLTRQAQEDPEQVLALAETFKQHKELSGQVKEVEDSFEKLRAKTEKSSEKLAELREALNAEIEFKNNNSRWQRFFSKRQEARKIYDQVDMAREKLRADKSFDLQGVDLSSEEGVEKALEQIEQAIVTVEKAAAAKDDLKRSIEQIRSAIFGDIEPAAMIFGRVHESLIQEVQGLTQSGDIKKLDKAQERLAKMSKPENARFFDRIFYVPGSEGSLEGLQENLDKKIQEAIADNILKTVRDFKFPPNRGFDALQRGLSGLINREAMGTKSGFEVKWFIHDTLSNILADEKNFAGPDGKAKKVLVKSLLLKI